MREKPISGTEALARVPLFAGLPAAELERLGACVRQRQYTRGEVIFLEGDVGNSLCVIASGRVKIVLTDGDGREIVLNVYGPGEFFGEFALLDGEPRSAGAVALDPCQLSWLRRGDFLRFLDKHPGAAATLLAVMSRRIRHTTRAVQDAAFRDVPARVARAILELAEHGGRSAPEGVVVEARLNQSELGSLVGASRETVNKCLRDYQRRGLIDYARGSITLLQPEKLRQHAKAT